MTVKTTILL